MNICKCTGLAVIGVIALSACSRQESVADAQKHADAAAIKGGERVMEAQRDAANRWLVEDWGTEYQDRIFASPYISLANVDEAVAELEWALDQGARSVVMRAAAPTTDAPGVDTPGAAAPRSAQALN